MAEGTPQKALRLTDWLILGFVLVVMGLLIADLRTNVRDVVGRSQTPTPPASQAGPS